MTEMQAAIGRCQLRKLDDWVKTRRENAAAFNRAFASLPALRLTLPPADVYHSYYKYYMFVRPEMLKEDWSRDRIMQAVNDAGIPCFSGSCSEIYLEKAFEKLERKVAVEMPRSSRGMTIEKERLAVAKELGETSLMLLVHPTLSKQNIEDTIAVVKKVVTAASR